MDIFHLQGDLQHKEVGNILRRAKAKRSSELPGSTTTLADYFNRELSLFEKRDKYLGNSELSQRTSSDIRNVVLVVAVLVATATYQTALSLPGGLSLDDYKSLTIDTENSIATNLDDELFSVGYVVLVPSLIIFGFNSAAFYTSMWVILVVILGLPYSTQLYFSLHFLLIAYLASLYITTPLPIPDGLVVVLGLISVTEPIIIFLAFRRHKRRTRQVDILKRRLENLV